MMEQPITCGHGCSLPHHACVTLVPIFQHLEPDQLLEVSAAIRPLTLRRQEILYRAGESSDALYIVNRGKVRIYRLSEGGKEQVIRILQQGDFTGEMALFRESVHESYAEALEETSICQITRRDLQALLLKYPSISLKVLAEFSERLDQSEKQATRIATEKADTRIAQFLVESMEHPGTPQEIVLPMNRKDLASYLGTTPETISRKLAEFEDAGYIRQLSTKRIEIIDADELLLL